MNLNIAITQIALRIVALFSPASVASMTAEIEEKIAELDRIAVRNMNYAVAHENLAAHIRSVANNHAREADTASRLAARLDDLINN